MCFTVTCCDDFCINNCDGDSAVLDLDGDDTWNLFENYFDQLSYEQQSSVVSKLFDYGYFENYNSDVLDKFYDDGCEEYLFKYIDLHFHQKHSMINFILEELIQISDCMCLKIIKRYINDIDISKIIPNIIYSDNNDIVLFLHENNKFKYTMHDIEIILSNICVPIEPCPRIFTSMFFLLPFDDVTGQFIEMHVKTREFNNYCKSVNFETFRGVIKKLNPRCIKIISMGIKDEFRSAYCKLVTKSTDNSTKTISRVFELIKQQTCTDMFRLITEFM